MANDPSWTTQPNISIKRTRRFIQIITVRPVSLQGNIQAEVSESVLLVELHLPDHRFESIAKFNEWYTRHKQESLR